MQTLFDDLALTTPEPAHIDNELSIGNPQAVAAVLGFRKLALVANPVQVGCHFYSCRPGDNNVPNGWLEAP
jgi:hypothetical protein